MKGSGIGCVLMFSNTYMATSDSLIRHGKTSSRSLALMEPNVPVLGEVWEGIPDFPTDDADKPIGDAAAALVGDDLVITGGFEAKTGWTFGAEETYSFNLKAHYEGQPVDWVKNDDNPIEPFVSHSGHAVKGGLFYHCGGYVGEDPGPETNDCYVFDKEKEQETQWTKIASLPEGRGGGAMVYVEDMDWLIFSLGAQRNVTGLSDTVDYDDTWMLDLSNETADWVSMAPIPYKGNRASAVGAKDCYGIPHYFFLGGQLEERENDGHLDDVYEYYPDRNEWEKRAPIPVGTGHVISSTLAYGCGFLIVGGSIDGNDLVRKVKTDEIFYYDIPTNTWTKVGDYADKTKSPACAIYEDKLYCASGYRREGYRTDISFPIELPLIDSSAAPTATAVPTAQPSHAPSTLPTPTPLWDDVVIRTKVNGGDFCPDASVVVRVIVAGEALNGVTVTLKNDELGIDLTKATNQQGRAKFAVSTANPNISGKYVLESCAYDAGGTSYCSTKRVEISCALEPTSAPIEEATATPSHKPSSEPSRTPSAAPTQQLTAGPTQEPSYIPSSMPSASPSKEVSVTPTEQPTSTPTPVPSSKPSNKPSAAQSEEPSSKPSIKPSAAQSREPSAAPSTLPTASPTQLPSSKPSNKPSVSPSREASATPTQEPTSSPSQVPSSKPSAEPSASPTQEPTSAPIQEASATPSQKPSSEPSNRPSAAPTQKPSSKPSNKPSASPSKEISATPTEQRTSAPTQEPSSRPSAAPTEGPTTTTESVVPTSQPSSDPSSEPTPAPLWDDIFINTSIKDGDFCPGAEMRVRVKVADEPMKGVPVTLKNEELGIDLEGKTNKFGRAKFTFNVTDTSLSGRFQVVGCAYDAAGTAYCDPKRVELSCQG